MAILRIFPFPFLLLLFCSEMRPLIQFLRHKKTPYIPIFIMKYKQHANHSLPQIGRLQEEP